jgi:hypothetical protein
MHLVPSAAPTPAALRLVVLASLAALAPHTVRALDAAVHDDATDPYLDELRAVRGGLLGDLIRNACGRGDIHSSSTAVTGDGHPRHGAEL